MQGLYIALLLSFLSVNAFSETDGTQEKEERIITPSESIPALVPDRLKQCIIPPKKEKAPEQEATEGDDVETDS